MAYKFTEEDPDIVNLFKDLSQKKDKLNNNDDEDYKIAKIKEINIVIEHIKNTYIRKILDIPNIRYQEDDLENYSITKVQEIYTNYKEYQQIYHGINKCNIIQFTTDNTGKYNYEGSFLILLVALFNKKNYILTKLFTNNENDLNKNIITVFNYISDKTHVNDKPYWRDINSMEDLIKDYVNKDRNNKYLNKIDTYFEEKTNQTNIYNFLYLFQKYLMRIPDDTCKTINDDDTYNKKIFYNVYHGDGDELKINNDNKLLSLKVLSEDGSKVDDVNIKDIPLIFLNINRKININENPIKDFLNNIYKLFNDFIAVFDSLIDDISNFHNVLMYHIAIFLDALYFIINECINNFDTNFNNFDNFKRIIHEKFEETIIYIDNIKGLINYTLYIDNFKELIHPPLNSNSSVNKILHDYYYENLIKNINIYDTLVQNMYSLLLLSKKNNDIKQFINYHYTFIQNFKITFDIDTIDVIAKPKFDTLNSIFPTLKESNANFKTEYIDKVLKIIDDDISDGLNSFNQFTDDYLKLSSVEITPKKVIFTEKIILENNVLYLNSIILKYYLEDPELYYKYKYICVFECNNSWYWYDSELLDNDNVTEIGNFISIFQWQGPGNEQDYVQKNVVGLFYT